MWMKLEFKPNYDHLLDVSKNYNGSTKIIFISFQEKILIKKM